MRWARALQRFKVDVACSAVVMQHLPWTALAFSTVSGAVLRPIAIGVVTALWHQDKLRMQLAVRRVRVHRDASRAGRLVVAVARLQSFLASTPLALSQLPLQCRPGWSASARDLHAAHR
jgi:hypothetical protein